jgi:hypothetical protein
LRWFSRYNDGRSYAEQVKPFGFLLALTANPVEPVELISGTRRARKPALRLPKPIAPFDSDYAKASAAAFDREPIVEMTGLSAAKVRKGLGGDVSILSGLLDNSALPRMRELAHSKHQFESAKTAALRKAVEEHGLREAARQLGMDPSNLRRRIKLETAVG